MAAVVLILALSLAKRESPLKPLKPVTSRIHFGKDNDVSNAKPAASTHPGPEAPVAQGSEANAAP
jgi:hypothetical protein